MPGGSPGPSPASRGAFQTPGRFARSTRPRDIPSLLRRPIRCALHIQDQPLFVLLELLRFAIGSHFAPSVCACFGLALHGLLPHPDALISRSLGFAEQGRTPGIRCLIADARPAGGPRGRLRVGSDLSSDPSRSIEVCQRTKAVVS
jgi:hypothetical protein